MTARDLYYLTASNVRVVRILLGEDLHCCPNATETTICGCAPGRCDELREREFAAERDVQRMRRQM